MFRSEHKLPHSFQMNGRVNGFIKLEVSPRLTGSWLPFVQSANYTQEAERVLRLPKRTDSGNKYKKTVHFGGEESCLFLQNLTFAVSCLITV